MWEHQGYKGSSTYFYDLDSASYYYLGPKLNDRVLSFKIDIGSCVEAYEHSPPSGKWFWTMDRDFQGFTPQSGMNDRISSMKKCGKNTVELRCPSNTFVKKIQWDGSNNLRGGLKLHCMPYFSPSAVSILNLHPYLSMTHSRECLNGTRGIRFSRMQSWEVDYAMEPDCHPGYTSGSNAYCASGYALTGVRMEVENRSRFIKSSRIYCSPWTSPNGRGSAINEVKVVEPLYLRNLTRSAIVKGAVVPGQDEVEDSKGRVATGGIELKPYF